MHAVSHKKRIALTTSLGTIAVMMLILSSQTTLAQSPCQDVCKPIYDDLVSLKADRTDFQNELKGAGPSEKPAIVSQIKKLNTQIFAKQAQYDSCEKAHGKNDLNTTFTGTATMTTNNSNASGPFVKNVTISGYFPHWCHSELEVTNFPAIVVGPYSTPIGSNTTTVTLVKEPASSVDPKTGKVIVGLSLHFHESNFAITDSDLLIAPSTDNPGGSRRKVNGAITLVADGTFKGGSLNNNTCHLIISGTLLPGP